MAVPVNIYVHLFFFYIYVITIIWTGFQMIGVVKHAGFEEIYKPPGSAV